MIGKVIFSNPRCYRAMAHLFTIPTQKLSNQGEVSQRICENNNNNRIKKIVVVKNIVVFFTEDNDSIFKRNKKNNANLCKYINVAAYFTEQLQS